MATTDNILPFRFTTAMQVRLANKRPPTELEYWLADREWFRRRGDLNAVAIIDGLNIAAVPTLPKGVA